MGITLHGIVEILWPASSWRPEEHWDAIARVEFNKDYQLMTALSKYLVDWPPDLVDRYKDEHVDQGPYEMGDLEMLVAAQEAQGSEPDYGEHDPPEPEEPVGVAASSPQLLGTIAFMRAVEASGKKVRILFWRC
jgi:hypothetical protein